MPVYSGVTNTLITNDNTVWRKLTGDGHTVVLEKQPLLEALPLTNRIPNLTLFGLAGVSYEVLFSSGLPAGRWQPVWMRIMAAGHSMPVASLTNLGPTMFFRSRAQAGDGP